MNFTREPIIETVITPREGCTLVIRSTKSSNQEEHFVEAVEVVSFGHSHFFRSQERPNSFLVPVSDYEVLELKEVRMALKNVATERSIKIGGGRDAPPRPREEPQDQVLSESRPAPAQESRSKQGGKRRRGRRGQGRHESQAYPRQDRPQEAPREEPVGPSVPEEALAAPAEKAPSFISKLFPPPPTLIKDLSRYKTEEGKIPESPTIQEPEDDNEE